MLAFLKTNVKNDITAIRPLIVIAQCIGMLPPIDLKNLGKPKSRRFYPVSLLIVFAAFRVLTTLGKIKYLNKAVEVTIQITDHFADYTLLLLNALCFIGMNVLNGKRIHLMLARLRKLDAEFRFTKPDSKYPNLQFCLELLTIHLMYLMLSGVNLYMWMHSMGFFVYQHFLLRDIQHYFVLIQVLLMRHCALLIKYRYELLNRILSHLSCRTSTNLMLLNGMPSKWCTRSVAESFKVLGEIVDDYNQIFGWHYFAMYIHILITLLLPINLALVYGDGQKHIAGVHFGSQLILLCLMFSTVPILLSLGIFSGGGVVAEASRTSTIAFNVLQEFPNDEKSQLARNELWQLAQRASANCPQLTAAGFFAVNYRTLFTLYGSIASYLIVLMQYNK